MSEKPKLQRSEQDIADQIVRVSDKLYERADKLQPKSLKAEVTHSGTSTAPVYYGLHTTYKAAELSDGTRIKTTHNRDGGTRMVDVYTGDDTANHYLRSGYLFNGRKVAKTTTYTTEDNGRHQTVATAEDEIINNKAPGWSTRYDNPELTITEDFKEIQGDDKSGYAILNAAETLGAIRGAIARAEIEIQQKDLPAEQIEVHKG